jgi:type I restriction enzyme, S subunit
MNSALPKDWKVERIGNVANLYRGISYSKDVATNTPSKTQLPILRANNIQGDLNYDDLVYVPRELIKDEQYIKKDDIIFAMSSGSKHLVGKSAVAKNNFDGSYGAFCALLRIKDSINKKYVSFVFQGNAYRKLISEIAKGTNINNLKREHILDFEFPLPPLLEQNRIVAKIEELFSELDKGIESLKTAQQQLKTYRQSVLKWAFEGKLTAEYRSQKLEVRRKEKTGNGELPEGWKWVKLGDIVDGVEYGSAAKSKGTGKVPVLRMGNIQNGRFDWSDLVYTSDNEEINKYLLKKDDVLFNRTNSAELVGKTAIYKGERKAIFAGYLIRINYKKEMLDPNYLTYYLNTWDAKQYGNTIRSFGVNQSNINGTKLKTYPLPIPLLEEQKRIVQEIESRLSVCDKLEETIMVNLQQCESLRQSILKKAFEGKLK